MKKIFKYISFKWLAILHDILVTNIAWLGAFILRFDACNQDLLLLAINMLPVVVVAQLVSYWCMGLYRGIWKFASIPDLSRIIKSILLGSSLSLLALFLIHRLDYFPRSIIIIYSLLLLVLLGGSRFLVRRFKDAKANTGKRILIIGANQYGESLARELFKNIHAKPIPDLPVAFIDNSLKKQGQEIHGLRVAGRYVDLAKVIQKYRVDLIIIAVPFLTSADKKELLHIAEQVKLPVRILPSSAEAVSGRISLNSLREISIEDLLGREQVSISWQKIAEQIYRKTVLITGAGGSIGSELCRQLIKLEPDLLVIIDNSEYNLFMISEELQRLQLQNKRNFRFKKHLINICDKQAVEHVMQKYKPQIIFHAAAFKHVPMLEKQVREAVKNNILGTIIVAKSAINIQANKFILISTDKAVNPINVMGITKRIVEMLCQQFNNSSATKFIAVRFGNVLGSVGSVVPTFTKQLEMGGPITVTHPDITRFFMTIVEACQLILQSLLLGMGGETFVLDMGEPIKIKDLAEKIIRLSGKVPYTDVKIEYTGLRAGERLHEKLFYSNEQLAKTKHPHIQLALPYEIDAEKLYAICLQLEHACNSYDESMLQDLLQQIIDSEVIYREKVNEWFT